MGLKEVLWGYLGLERMLCPLMRDLLWIGAVVVDFKE